MVKSRYAPAPRSIPGLPLLPAQRGAYPVGLTTAGEAKHWVAGAGSRFEHYERLDPQQLPTHWRRPQAVPLGSRRRLSESGRVTG